MGYFERARWPATWLKNARDMVRDEYDLYYAAGDDNDDHDGELDASSAAQDVPVVSN